MVQAIIMSGTLTCNIGKQLVDLSLSACWVKMCLGYFRVEVLTYVGMLLVMSDLNHPQVSTLWVLGFSG